MIRRHATWMVIHPRSATSYLACNFNFGEVFRKAIIRCCVRCWGPFGLAQLLGRERSRGTRDPTVGSEVLPYFLGRGRTAMERRPYLSVAQERDPPLVSGRWRVLGAALRRAIASRRAIPADVKDQSYHPLHPSSHGECEKVYPISPPLSSGKCGFWKLCEGVQGLTGDLRQETRDMTRQ